MKKIAISFTLSIAVIVIGLLALGSFSAANAQDTKSDNGKVNITKTTVSDKTTTDTDAATKHTVTVKLAEHAPDLADPDYAAKKEEWIKNYPDEYKALITPKGIVKSNANGETRNNNKGVSPQRSGKQAPSDIK